MSALKPGSFTSTYLASLANATKRYSIAVGRLHASSIFISEALQQPKKVLVMTVRIIQLIDIVYILYYVGTSIQHVESDSGFESSSHPTVSISGRLSTLSHHTDSTGIVIPDGISDNEDEQAHKVCTCAHEMACDICTSSFLLDENFKRKFILSSQ